MTSTTWKGKHMDESVVWLVLSLVSVAVVVATAYLCLVILGLPE